MDQNLLFSLRMTFEQLDRLHGESLKASIAREDTELNKVLKAAEQLKGHIQDVLIREDK